MKFGKLLSRAEEVLPDLKLNSLRYKLLKKRLSQLPVGVPASCEANGKPTATPSLRQLSDQEQEFIDMLNEDMKRFNDYFCDKEEEVVIWMQQLEEQSADAKTLHEKQLCHVGYIHLHGQLVLLYHWSMLNYAALVKILKKHDKHTGITLKAPFLSNALKQPFSTTGVVSSLMQKCEAMAQQLNESTGGLETLMQNCPQYEGLLLMKETEAALELWGELRTNVSTPSTFIQDQARQDEGDAEHASKRARPSTDDPAGDGAGPSHEAHARDAADASAGAVAPVVAESTAEVPPREGALARGGGDRPLAALRGGTAAPPQ